ncbi:MAG: hypothetical protein KA712_12670 [Myxococcales bacterium]|nr:hypothetical protein [Myxococcales bacterium]
MRAVDSTKHNAYRFVSAIFVVGLGLTATGFGAQSVCAHAAPVAVADELVKSRNALTRSEVRADVTFWESGVGLWQQAYGGLDLNATSLSLQMPVTLAWVARMGVTALNQRPGFATGNWQSGVLAVERQILERLWAITQLDVQALSRSPGHLVHLAAGVQGHLPLGTHGIYSMVFRAKVQRVAMLNEEASDAPSLFEADLSGAIRVRLPYEWIPYASWGVEVIHPFAVRGRAFWVPGDPQFEGHSRVGVDFRFGWVVDNVWDFGFGSVTLTRGRSQRSRLPVWLGGHKQSGLSFFLARRW